MSFATARGGVVEKARLGYLLTQEPPSAEAVAVLVADQRSDGGWPASWAHGASSLDATCFRLAQAVQIGITAEEPAIARALTFLAQRQRSDGSWEEEVQRAVAPFWVKPGDQAATLYLTANSGFWLAVLARPSAGALLAAGYLAACLSSDGHLPSFLHTHWLAGGLWWRLGQYERAEGVFRYLRKRLTADVAASNLGWLVNALHAVGVPSSHPLIEAAASLLERHQRADGSWPSEDGPDYDVHSTLEATRALRLCGRF